MKYNKYLKELGVKRLDFFKLKHFGIRNEFERLKYGTNYHEMRVLDIILACEIYPRLRHLYDKYHYVCNFSTNADGSHNESDDHYEKKADENFKRVLNAFEIIIKVYFNIIEEEFEDDVLENENSQNNQVKNGLEIFSYGLWGVGI